ncbi:MAG: DUF1800 domain-containing protein [Acidobacteriia bacterium]|nr:DUF1800 domain-containing protein [Terriglobia bacterium]
MFRRTPNVHRLVTWIGHAAVLAMCIVTARAQQPSTNDTVRFLEQATFGPNSNLITQVQSLGFSAFLDQQIALPVSGYPPLPLQPTTVPSTCTGTCVRDNYSMYPVQVTFFQNAINAPDQLRQRVAFALQQIMVTSGITITQPSWMTPYLQIFENDAFGNFRTLLGDITLNPAMGRYLNMAGNTKAAPNENYGREVLQLFTVGLNLLNLDGSLQTDSQGHPIPTYTQPVVDGFSKVFTGWNFAPPVASGVPDYIDPMVLNPSNHDGSAKLLLQGVTLPATSPVTAATATADLNAALDNIFNHPNVGPFISRNLIEHLVTSNPSPGYIARVASVFNNNGNGVRGDLSAVVRAILLDTEARTDPAGGGNPEGALYGHLQEPELFIARLLRAFNTTSATTDFVLADGYLPSNLQMGENLFLSPSVFNYYPPSFPIPGVTVNGALVNGPEFALMSTSAAINRINFVAEVTYHSMSVSSPNRPTGTWLDLSSITPLITPPSGSAAQLVGYLNTLMLHGQGSAGLLQTVTNAINGMTNATPLSMAQRAVYLIGSSPEYIIER